MDSELYQDLRQQLKDGFAGVNGRLDKLNSKVADHGEELAVLQDRSDRSERQAGIAGAVTGGVASGVVLAMKAFFGK